MPPDSDARPGSADNNVLSYLQGPIVGGGFNVKSRHLATSKAGLQPTHGHASDNTIDLEAAG